MGDIKLPLLPPPGYLRRMVHPGEADEAVQAQPVLQIPGAADVRAVAWLPGLVRIRRRWPLVPGWLWAVISCAPAGMRSWAAASTLGMDRQAFSLTRQSF